MVIDNELFIIEQVKSRFKHSNEYTDVQIQVYVDEVLQNIKNYCNIPKVPVVPLRFTIINMTVDLLEYMYERTKASTNTSIEDIDVSDVSSISVGDTSIDIGNTSNQRNKALRSHKNNLDRIIMNYTAQLNKFRRLY
mgnify:CR=1 FL=1